MTIDGRVKIESQADAALPGDAGQSLMDMAYERIKKRIIDLTFPPGSSLTEAGLAEALATSRMPVRMAVRRLENEGWLIADFRRKIRVRPITRQDVREIYQLRDLLESGAMEMIFAQKRNWEYAHRIEEKVVRMKAAQRDPFEWERADTELHMEIVSVYGNERINRIYRNNQDELIRIGLLSAKQEIHVQEIITNLYKFVEAVREDAFPAAMAILRRDHLEAGLEMALAKISKE